MLACRPAWASGTVVVQLKWTHAFQFAGYYMAEALGYYRDAGLQVRFAEWKPGLSPVDEVLAGRAHFGIGSSSLLLERARGRPVVVLAVIHQHSPQILIARQDKAMQSVHDLVNGEVMLEPQSEELLAYLQREGIPPERLRRTTHSALLDEFIAGDVVAISAYSSYEPFFLDKLGLPYQVYTPRAVGIDFYGDNLFTSESLLRRNRQQVEAFREASMRGWQHAMTYPEEAIALIRERYAPQLSEDFLRYEARRLAELTHFDLVEVGYMTEGRWRHIADTYAELGLVSNDLSLDGFLLDQRADLKLKRAYRTVALLAAVIVAGSVLLGYVYLTKRHLVSTQLALERSEARYRMLTEQMQDVVWVIDLELDRITYISPSVRQLQGYSAEEIVNDAQLDLLAPESRERLQGLVSALKRRFEAGEIDESHHETIEIEPMHKDGGSLWVEAVCHLARNPEHGHLEVHGVTRDIAERRRQEALIRHLAKHDPLTGLANRALFSDLFERSLALAERERCGLALIFIDLDEFKPVNDDHGHAIGDQLLRAATERIRATVRKADVLARLGGDEFVLLLHNVGDRQAALATAVKIRHALAQPFSIEGRKLKISCSQGIALYPEHGGNEMELTRNADMAMYQAKRAGGHAIRVYGDDQVQSAPAEDSQSMAP